MPTQLKIALVYDWIDTPYGGAEKVLMALQEIFPQAVLFTSIYSPTNAPWAKNFLIKTSFLQKFPFRSFRIFTSLFMPLAFESLDLSAFNVIISVSSGPAKGVITRPDQLHINYCLTPPRYLFTHKKRYFQSIKYSQLPILKTLIDNMINYLTWWDLAASSRPDVYVPISRVVRKRIEKNYHRQTEAVIYPPVYMPKSSTITPAKSADYYLVVARLVGYKKVDVAIKACEQLHRKLVIVGTGSELHKLQMLAKSSNTIFVGNIGNDKLTKLYNQARALIMVGEEDFGITGLEALAMGVPVIVNTHSGVAELIEDGLQGVHLSDESVGSLITAIKKVETINFDPKKLQHQSQTYQLAVFKQQFKQLVTKKLQQFLV